MKEKNLIPITKANNIEHIKLNLEALDIIMRKEDYDSLNKFRHEGFDNLDIDLEDNGVVSIYKIANQMIEVVK